MPVEGVAKRLLIDGKLVETKRTFPSLNAARIANDSIFGLCGEVYSADQDRAIAVARRSSGTVGVNGGMWFTPDAPFGGYKQSGIGREMGASGLEEFLERKTIAAVVA